MNRLFNLTFTIAALLCMYFAQVAHAQMFLSAASYQDGFYDPVTQAFVGITSVVDSSTIPSGAYHSFTSTVTVGGPGGRVSTNSGGGYSQASLLIDGQDGIYTVAGSGAGTCSFAGPFFVSPMPAVYVPLRRIQAYYYYTGSQSGGRGVYRRCNPIGTTCDNCDIILGSPVWQYGLFNGAEINIGTTSTCAMVAQQQVDRCSSPDPIPGGGGVGVSATSRSSATR